MDTELGSILFLRQLVVPFYRVTRAQPAKSKLPESLRTQPIARKFIRLRPEYKSLFNTMWSLFTDAKKIMQMTLNSN